MIIAYMEHLCQTGSWISYTCCARLAGVKVEPCAFLARLDLNKAFVYVKTQGEKQQNSICPVSVTNDRLLHRMYIWIAGGANKCKHK